MKTVRLTMRNGNRLTLEPIDGGAIAATVVDHDGATLASWSGDLPDGLGDLLTTATWPLARCCAACGATYRAKRTTSRYCSQRCRTRAFRTRRADS